MRRPSRPSGAVALAWTRERWPYLALIGLVFLYYLWSATTVGPGSHFYNQLADAFKAGQLDLLTEPSKELQALEDPLDPAQNVPYKMHDASYYEGKYYLYFGASPALLFFLPYLLITGGHLESELVVAIQCTIGFAGMLAVLRRLRFRFAPRAPGWTVALAAIAMATATSVPFLLRRVEQYEVAISGAFMGTWIALWLMLKVLDGVEGRTRTVALVGAGLALGYGFSARPTVACVALLAFPLAWWLRRHRGGLREPALLLGPLVACGLLVAAYNAARFDSPLEFGTSYVLSSIDPRSPLFAQAANIPKGLWFYLWAPSPLHDGFPFWEVDLPAYPGTLPPGYSLEYVAGIRNVPFVFALVALPFLLLRGRRADRAVALGIVGALGAGLLTLLFIAWQIPGATQRYQVDIAPFFVLPAAVVVLAAVSRAPGRVPRVVLGLVSAFFLLWGTAWGAATGMRGYGDWVRKTQPNTWSRLINATAPIPTLISKLRGEPYIAEIDYAEGTTVADVEPSRHHTRPTFDVGVDRTDLVIAAGSPGRYVLRARFVPGPGQPEGGGRFAITVRQLDTGREATFETATSQGDIDLNLRRGVNRVRFTARALDGTPTDARRIATISEASLLKAP